MLRDSGPKVIKVLKRVALPLVIYLNDVTVSKSVSETVVAYLMSLVARLRLDVPVIPVLSKSDLLKRQLKKTFLDELTAPRLEGWGFCTLWGFHHRSEPLTGAASRFQAPPPAPGRRGLIAC